MRRAEGRSAESEEERREARLTSDEKRGEESLHCLKVTR